MARYRIVWWRDLPSAVEAADPEGEATRALSERFQALIDGAAMRRGLAGADAYLDGWRRGEEAERPGTARDVAEAVVAELEARWDEFRARGGLAG